MGAGNEVKFKTIEFLVKTECDCELEDCIQQLFEKTIRMKNFLNNAHCFFFFYCLYYAIVRMCWIRSYSDKLRKGSKLRPFSTALNVSEGTRTKKIRRAYS